MSAFDWTDAAAIVFVVCIIFFINIVRKSQETEWHPTDVGPVMGRKIDGKWETRPMTPEEETKWNEDRAW